jgi:hypothetical protein
MKLIGRVPSAPPGPARLTPFRRRMTLRVGLVVAEDISIYRPHVYETLMYVKRPVIANERLKSDYRDGTTHIVMSPPQLLQ